MNTGIQRTVRRLLDHLGELSAEHGFDAEPVTLSRGQFKRLDPSDISLTQALGSENVVPKEEKTLKQRIGFYLRDVYDNLRRLLAAVCGHADPIERFLFAPRQVFGLNFLVYHSMLKPFRVMMKQVKSGPVAQPQDFDRIGQDDILLLLDSSWHSDIWKSVEKIRERHIPVICVIYDIIPITHSQFCDNFLVEEFKAWFRRSLDYVDGYIAISQTVMDDVRAYMIQEYGESVRQKYFDFFHLGADFKDYTFDDSEIRSELRKIFFERPTYIIVSTLEPRKNHQYLLDAFQNAWENYDLDVNLFIIGRMGFNSELIASRIRNSEEFGKRLFYWSTVNDDELRYCYRHARMLVFPSIAEGFGLPIVESLSMGLPVLASDTAIHREVGGSHIGYFDVSDPTDLTRWLVRVETVGIPDALRVSAGYRWISWRESGAVLLDKMLTVARSCQFEGRGSCSHSSEADDRLLVTERPAI